MRLGPWLHVVLALVAAAVQGPCWCQCSATHRAWGAVILCDRSDRAVVAGQTGYMCAVRLASLRSDRPTLCDSMPRESICGDGPGVGLGIRRRPWWSEIMRDT
uniref:Secreted protein n=1 Tax=Oryza sativa subsp. japonica TaxID=39947 RepID=Q8W2W2_ORYSJ|nr:hypothetical protein [Oryza sativa Japonica Group]